MIIKKLVLENIRSHTKLSMEFKSGITVITGRTGSGKSTILMAAEYALFGNETGISYSSLLRRGCSKGRIKLGFEHEGDEYEIVRGFVRKKSGISFDKDALRLTVNNSVVPVIARVKDFDEKIKRLTGYDANMFGVMSYTRQDEIRKLVELRNEARQEYIDEILQLSKYKLAWNNLKEVVTEFNNNIVKLEAETAFKKELENEIKNLEKERSENAKEKEKLELEIKRLSADVDELRKKYEASVERKNVLESLFEKSVSAAERKEYLKERLEKMKRSITHAKERMPAEVVRSVQELEEEHEQALKKIYANKTLLRVHIQNLEKISGVSEGVCPTCKQRVSKVHLRGVRERIGAEMDLLRSELEALEKKEKKLKDMLETSLKKEELLKRVEELEKEMFEVEKEMREAGAAVLKDYSSELEGARERFEKNLKEFREVSATRESKKQNLEYLETSLKNHLKRIEEKKSRLKQIILAEKSLVKARERFALLNRLREDIRGIREVVRDNFLEQVREEFQKRFEEVRRFEDEYTVDVLNNYEPVAYSISGDATPLAALSGGEKTSVALSYRIALSNIAAEIADVSQSELLVLDEPTIGFDSEDVKILPEILEKIRIKQIII
jgi:exonuclease SbcC